MWNKSLQPILITVIYTSLTLPWHPSLRVYEGRDHYYCLVLLSTWEEEVYWYRVLHLPYGPAGDQTTSFCPQKEYSATELTRQLFLKWCSLNNVAQTAVFCLCQMFSIKQKLQMKSMHYSKKSFWKNLIFWVFLN